jgi:hypothetical protein
VENIQRIAKILHIPATSFFTPDQQQSATETSLPYASPDEKTLLRHYRDLSAKSDRNLAIAIIRRIARK